MKRLLAYLFIVLGLGLTFSVSAKAEKKYLDLIFCESTYPNESEQHKYVAYLKSYKGNECSNIFKSYKNISFNKFKTSSYKNLCYSTLPSILGQVFKTKLQCSYFKLPSIKYDGSKFYYNSKQTQIAKAEPSQTQPVKEFTKIAGEGIGSDNFYTYELTSGGKPTKDTKWSLKYAEEQACLEAQKNTYRNAFTKSGVPINNSINRYLIAAIVNEKVLRKNIKIDINEKNLKCDYSSELLVKTSELNKFASKSKKKVKVAKKEPKQEELIKRENP